MLPADDFNELLGGVGVVGVGEDALGGVEADGVLVSAEEVDGVAADAQARPRDEALIDGVADGGVGGAGAFSAHVALGGVPGEEVGFGGFSGEKGAPGNGFLDGLQVFGAGVQKEVHMGVNEAGKQRGVAEVDDLGALRVVNQCGDGANAIALDKNLAGPEERAGIDLEQAGGVENDGRGCRLLGGHCPSESQA